MMHDSFLQDIIIIPKIVMNISYEYYCYGYVCCINITDDMIIVVD